MPDYKNGLAERKRQNNGSPSARQLASKDELFRASRKYLGNGPASLARTAAELLYWSQFAEHRLKGRKGIYKENSELGNCLGIHPKTAGRHVLALCATGSNDEPGAKVQLFELAHGPKPQAYGGRVRWLFIRPEGAKIIAEALEEKRLRRERAAPTDGNEKLRPRGARHSNRSPQNAPTPSHTYLPDRRSEKLSIQPAEEREPTTSKSKESQGKIEMGAKENTGGVSEAKVDSQGQVNRLVATWRRVCELSNKRDLIWRDHDLNHWSDQLAKTVADLRLHEISDTDLEAQLTVLCTKIDDISEEISEAFAKYNRHGLELSSFVMYGPKLMTLAAEKVASEPAKKAKPGGKMQTCGELANFKHAGATFE